MSNAFLMAMGREDRIPGRVPGQGRGAEKPPKTANVANLPRHRALTTELLDKATERVREKVGSHIFDLGDWAGATLPAAGGSFADWTGGINNGRHPSQSEADQALCGCAARELVALGVADRDELTEGVRTIMGRSALSQRPKWERHDYSSGTIAKAVAPFSARQALHIDSGATQGVIGDVEPDLRRGDILAAEVFIDQHGTSLRYCVERGAWLWWTGLRWHWATQDDITELAKETAGRILDAAREMLKLDPEKGGKLVKFAVKYHSLDGLRAMIQTARSDKRIRVRLADLDADQYLLGVQNGYVNLRTGEFFPPDPAKLITRCAGVDYIEGATCPQWLTALNVTHDDNQEIVNFLKRAYGYTFSGRNDEEVMFICYGHGNNGKSVQQDVIHYVGGDIVCMGDISLLVYQKNDTRIPNALAATAGARQLSLNETSFGDELDTRQLKVLAGREPITARFLHQEFFTFQSTATPWLRTNHRPIVKDDSDGVWRRMVLIPFRHKFTQEEIIPRIEDRLREEGSGILSWIISGAVDYFKHGLRIPECIRRESDAYRSESDVLGEWMDEATEVNPTYKIEQAVLWANWQGHCRSNGHHPGTKNTFSRRLKERGFAAWQSNNRRYYIGLNIRGSQGGLPPRV